MAFTFSPFKSAWRAGAVAMLLTTLPIATLPVFAAPAHAFQNYQSDNGNAGNGSPFNVDQDPCNAHPGRHREPSDGTACPDDLADHGLHGNNGQRHPGSNAFGLQFNSGDD